MRKQKRALRRKITDFLIIYFLVFTLNFTANTFSKYVGRIDGNGSMNVAKWDVDVDNEISTKSISLVSGNTSQEYSFDVSSNSEIATNYNVILTNVPNDVKVSIDGHELKTPNNNKVEFPNAGSFNAKDLSNTNSNIHTHTLRFETTIDTEIQNNTNINLSIIFEQEEL